MKCPNSGGELQTGIAGWMAAALITTRDVCSRLAHKSFHTQRDDRQKATGQQSQVHSKKVL